ncbi:hypothetical protein H0H93_009010 [Arthromyces matolae]|nr:hypothetical protein H0H93_009010 [Arthromyces matolae]
MNGTPLPVDPPELLQKINFKNAYNRVRTFEVEEQVSKSKDQRRRLLQLRVLGYIIIQASTLNGDGIVKDVEYCTNKDDLLNLVSKFRGRTPYQSKQPSRPSYVNLQEAIQATLTQAPQSHTAAKQNALLRDGYRCVVTGVFDAGVKNIANWRDIVGKGWVVHTECAHIIPEGILTDISNNPEKSEKTSHFGAIVQSLGYGDLLAEVNSVQIHRLDNVISLERSVHDKFDRMELWFEATNTAHTYRLCGADETDLNPSWNREVTFRATRDDLSLPNPRYLEIHAACCRIAHLSGAAEYIEKFERDLESTCVLANDGSSGQLLFDALAPWSYPIIAH